MIIASQYMRFRIRNTTITNVPNLVCMNAYANTLGENKDMALRLQAVTTWIAALEVTAGTYPSKLNTYAEVTLLGFCVFLILAFKLHVLDAALFVVLVTRGKKATCCARKEN